MAGCLPATATRTGAPPSVPALRGPTPSGLTATATRDHRTQSPSRHPTIGCSRRGRLVLVHTLLSAGRGRSAREGRALAAEPCVLRTTWWERDPKNWMPKTVARHCRPPGHGRSRRRNPASGPYCRHSCRGHLVDAHGIRWATLGHVAAGPTPVLGSRARARMAPPPTGPKGLLGGRSGVRWPHREQHDVGRCRCRPSCGHHPAQSSRAYVRGHHSMSPSASTPRRRTTRCS